jgi:inactivated superfamily I helicase
MCQVKRTTRDFSGNEKVVTQSLSNQVSNQTPTRVDLNWDTSVLKSAAQWLVEQHTKDQQLNLGDFIVALPTARSRRRLLQMLIAETDTRSLLFTPPNVTTVGRLPEYLYPQEKPLASELTRRMAWIEAIKRSDQEQVLTIFPRIRSGEIRDFMAAATILQRLHSRLAADILSFRSVEREIDKLSEFPETDRWITLASIQSNYYKVLEEVDLWDQQAARSVAVRKRQCRTDKQIVLVGVADLNRSLRGMMEQVAVNVTTLVFCDPKHSDRFDGFGGIVTKAWTGKPLEIPNEKFVVVENPADQGFAVANYLSNLEGDFQADQITVGAPDDAIVPQIERSLNSIGLEPRNLSGIKFEKSAAIRLLVTIREFLKRGDYASYAEMVRHPDMYRWLNEATEKDGSWLAKLDQFQQSRLPGRVELNGSNQFPPGSDLKGNPLRPHLEEVFAAVQSLLLPVATGIKLLQDWADPWVKIMLTVYETRELNERNLHDRLLLKSCEVINEAFTDQQEMPSQWQVEVSSDEALDLAIQATSLRAISDEPSHGAVEIANWLDLRLDDAEVMVVTSFNDQYVPAVENAGLFLPNSLCRTLKIEDNDRRYARDAYFLGMINAAREKLLLIAGRKQANGDPMVPSRLLMATDPGNVALRAKAFFSHPGSEDRRFWLADPKHLPQNQQFGIPNPAEFDDVSDITRTSVTKFKQYMQCPYRYYLERIAKLQVAEDNAREMDGGTFGTLAHDVLYDFAIDDSIKDSADAVAIGEYLNERLNARVDSHFGESRLPAVSVQIEQLRLRLQLFAGLQAQQRQDGWKIVYAEEEVFHELDVDGEPFTINGIIDRVDRHEETGQIFVWDYKTSDAGDEPNKTHWNHSKGWVDLQLPLYRHLVTELKFQDASFENVGMGYILLPRDLKKIAFAPAYWKPHELAQADLKAHEIVRNLRNKVFWPPNPQPPRFSGDYAGICRQDVFEKPITEGARR